MGCFYWYIKALYRYNKAGYRGRKNRALSHQLLKIPERLIVMGVAHAEGQHPLRRGVLLDGGGAGTCIYHFTVCNVCCVVIYQ